MDPTLRRATGLPVVLAISLLALAVVWNAHDERRKTLHAYQATLQQLLESQKKFIAQEVFLHQEEAIRARLHAIANSVITKTGDASVCVFLMTQADAGPQKLTCTADITSPTRLSSPETFPVELAGRRIAALSAFLVLPSIWNDLPKPLMFIAIAIISAALVHWQMIVKLRETVLRPLLEDLAKKERAAALSEAAQMLAHDVRRPFALLRLTLYGLIHDPNRKTSYAEALQEVERGIGIVEQLIAGVLELRDGRLASMAPFPFKEEINRIIDETRKLHPDKRPCVLLEIAHLEEPLCDSKRISRVLLNLIENAFQAVNPEGRIEIQTANSCAEGSSWFELWIRNSGSPIQNEIQKQLFKPFVTGKASGTGLGLVITKRLIEEHGGSIDYHSSGDHGTIFHFKILVKPSQQGLSKFKSR